MNTTMSAIGPKRTSATALHMSAFGGNADMYDCTAKCLLLTQSGHRSPLFQYSSEPVRCAVCRNSKNDGSRREPQVGQFDRRFDPAQPFFVLSVDFSAGYGGILRFRDSARG